MLDLEMFKEANETYIAFAWMYVQFLFYAEESDETEQEQQEEVPVCNQFGFYPVVFDHYIPHNELLKYYSKGTESADIKELQEVFGECKIKIDCQSTCELFIEQFLSPYNLFQGIAVVIWLT